MKVFIVWLLVMHDATGAHTVTGFVHREPCESAAAALTASAGDARGMRWTCDKQGIER